MRLSRRIAGIVPGGDDGWELYYRAREMIAAGEPVVMLTIGDHDVGPDRLVTDAVRAALARGHTGYTPVEGTPGLRAAIAERLGRPVAEVCVTAGGQAGLFASMMAVLDPGEACVVLDPYYATYAQTVRAASGTPLIVGTRAENGFEPDPAAIRAALTPETRAILLNTPNNPTGAVYTRDALEGIAALAAERDLWVISDEVYDTQVWEGAHVSPSAVAGLAERTLVVGSMSKSHGMTGFRIGWVAGPAPAIARIADLGVTTTYGLPGFVMDAAEAALRHGAAAEAAIADRYRARRAAALSALEGAEGIGIAPAEGGMYLLLDIRATGLTGIAFAERLLERAGVAVMPGESFGHAAAGHVRVALTVPEETLLPALAELRALAAELARSPASAAATG